MCQKQCVKYSFIFHIHSHFTRLGVKSMKNSTKKPDDMEKDIKKVVLTTRQILLYMVDFYVGFSAFFDGGFFRKTINDYWQWRDLDKECFSKTIYRLKKDKFIDCYNHNNEKYIELTKKGIERVRVYITDEVKIPIPEEWDNKWRIIIFDIPNEKKTVRDILASKLKKLGFFRLQKSVFVYPYECKTEIDFLKKIYKIEPYVQYILADQIEADIDLFKHFFSKNL